MISFPSVPRAARRRCNSRNDGGKRKIDTALRVSLFDLARALYVNIEENVAPGSNAVIKWFFVAFHRISHGHLAHSANSPWTSSARNLQP